MLTIEHHTCIKLVGMEGLEPSRCCHPRIFLLLYVTIAALLRCSLDYVFTICAVRTLRQLVYSLYTFIWLHFFPYNFQSKHGNWDIIIENSQEYYYVDCHLYDEALRELAILTNGLNHNFHIYFLCILLLIT